MHDTLKTCLELVCSKELEDTVRPLILLVVSKGCNAHRVFKMEMVHPLGSVTVCVNVMTMLIRLELVFSLGVSLNKCS